MVNRNKAFFAFLLKSLSCYLAYNQLPEKELNYTSLSILTRYCL